MQNRQVAEVMGEKQAAPPHPGAMGAEPSPAHGRASLQNPQPDPPCPWAESQGGLAGGK